MSRTRMAFESLPQAQRTIVRDALRPWNRNLGVSIGNGNLNADLWQGATPESFITRHDALRDDLVSLLRSRHSGYEQDMRNLLMQRHNHNLEDANDQIRRLRNSRNPETEDLQKLKMSVPQAEADEIISQAALKLSGYGNVESLKGATTKATDIYTEVTPMGGDPYEVLIDAQVRGNPSGRLNLSVLKDLNLNAADVLREYRDLPRNTLLMDYIRKLRDRSRVMDNNPSFQSAKEGKLFATDSNFNDAPTNYFNNNADYLRKDAIITSLRPLERDINGNLLVNPDHPRFARNTSSFNPTLPQGWDLMDLDEARYVLDRMRVGDVRRNGFTPFFNANRRTGLLESINLGISPDRIKQMTGNLPPLSSAVHEVLVTKPPA